MAVPIKMTIFYDNAGVSVAPTPTNLFPSTDIESNDAVVGFIKNNDSGQTITVVAETAWTVGGSAAQLTIPEFTQPLDPLECRFFAINVQELRTLRITGAASGAGASVTFSAATAPIRIHR